ncbi:MAG: sugar phosphate isomerase/epimerase [Bryobacterales bacterium]|nr:sugar phosphate isomerase/epimerase [Bryobacterales bacterium]
MTRRSLLWTGAASLMAAQRKVRLGGPIYLKSEDPRELAREHRRLGYAAAYCPAADPKDTARTRAIAEAFAAENVAIAEVGAWKNMLDPDAARRRENIEYVTMRLELAEAVGARCCVDIAGSFHATVWYGPHKDNLSPRFFDATVENVRKVIDAVKPKRTTFSVEMMGWSIPNSADSYLKLMKAVDRKQFSVHVDVCNIINSPERIYNNAAVIEEVFRKLGRWVSSCHAKDLAWVPEMNVHFVEVIPGRGEMDYKAYLRNLASIPADAPLMLEHLKNAAEYEEGAAYIRKTAAACGVALA